MRRLLLLSLFLISASTAAAQVRFDTLGTRPIGPGMIHTHIVEHNTPWNINVVEIDLTNPDIRMQAMKGQNRRNGLETVSSMAARYDREGHRVAVAVNADFFASGVPVGMSAVDGEIVVNAVPNRQSVGFSDMNDAMIEVPAFSGSLTAGDESVTIRGVNRARQSDDLVLFNSYWGAGTGTNDDGVEILVDAIGDWAMNQTVNVIVEDVREDAGNSSLPRGKAVLSATGSYAQQLLALVEQGDTLAIDLTITPGVENLKQVVSGGPFLVVDGKVDVGPRGDGVDRHPRTAVGLDESGDRFYIVTVDGRQGASAGMTLRELAEFMLSMGAHRAVNLDGGGSTTLVIHGESTNMLLGPQRAVTNGLAAITFAEFGDAQEVRVRQPYVRLFRGESTRLLVDGFDDNLHLVPFDTTALTFEIDEQVGTVSHTGWIEAGSAAAAGYAYVHYNGTVDSVLVTVKDIERIDVYPTGVVVDTSLTHTFQYSVFDSDGVRQSLPVDSVSWHVLDESIGWISPDGTFHGMAAGETGVVGSYRDAADTVYVEVQLGSGVVLLDEFDTTDGWSIASMSNLDAAGSGLSIYEGDDGERMLQVDYRVPANASGVIQMIIEKEIPLYGVPDSLKLDVISDGGRHRIYFGARDHVNGAHDRIFPFYIDQTELDSIHASVVFPNATYPLRLTRLTLQFAPVGDRGEVREGTLLIDNLRVQYPDVSAVSAPRAGELPDEITLFQNYPNPFNPTTRIEFALAKTEYVTLKIYDVLGREVMTLRDGVLSAGLHAVDVDASQLASGTYFYVLENESQRQARSMVLLK